MAMGRGGQVGEDTVPHKASGERLLKLPGNVTTDEGLYTPSQNPKDIDLRANWGRNPKHRHLSTKTKPGAWLSKLSPKASMVLPRETNQF